jgi:hypothetical protein
MVNHATTTDRVMNVAGGDQQDEQQPQGVRGQVPFTTFDPLAIMAAPP